MQTTYRWVIDFYAHSAWGKESRDGAFRRVEDMDLNDMDRIIFHETFSEGG